MTAAVIRGSAYPVLLPKLRDPRLHLAATITSLQVIGQVGFHFDLSIAQILVSLAVAGLIDFAIALRRRHVLMWPASALLTGNGVAFVLRVPGTVHGDWWSLRGWWIYAGTAAAAVLSKHLLRWRGEHVFNPSNFGLVLCFLVLGRLRADPLAFWWGPMSAWLLAALCVIVAGGFAILSRLALLRVALGFWASFAAGIGVLAATGHVMVARWHLGPITGFHFWLVLVTSPEVLVFLFFMITDPKTAPRSPRGRLVYALSLGLLGALMIAPTTTEYASKVALLGSLALVCIALPILRRLALPLDSRLALVIPPAVAAAFAVAIVLSGHPGSTALASPSLTRSSLPPIVLEHSPGVQTQLDRRTGELIASALVAAVPATASETVSLHLAAGTDQSPPHAVAVAGGRTYRLDQSGNHWRLQGAAKAPSVAPPVLAAPLSGSLRLRNVAARVGLDFRQGAFRFGTSNDYRAMMGGGVCFLDFNDDGWVDLYAVNSYASSDAARFEAHGGLPRAALFENEHGRFVATGRRSGADLAVQGDGCVAADLNGDGRTDLVVTTTTGIDLLWNTGGGRFVEGARAAGMTESGWYTGAAVADVNGDGRPDVFVAGYSDPNEPVPGSLAGFPTSLAGVRDLLFLNLGNGPGGRAAFREVGIQAGLEAASPRHGLGATFVDANRDGRPDLYVANDEDPNDLYVNVPWPGGASADPSGLGFRLEERGAAEHVADPYAGMGIAVDGGTLLVTNSRNERAAAYRLHGGSSSPAYGDARNAFDRALGSGFAGWGASFVDLANTGTPDLVLAAGGIPVRSLRADAEPLRVLGPRRDGAYGDLTRILGAKGLRLNGRGLATADVFNNGRMEVAVNTIGGRLVLLQPSGSSGHWLDVRLTRFAPGAVVSVVLPSGKRLVEQVRAGGSYLSSDDPRVHFGLGAATRVEGITVRVPGAGVTRVDGVAADRVVEVPVPARAPVQAPVATSPVVANCVPQLHGGSVARDWNRTAVAVLRDAQLPEPVQARDLFHLSAAMWDAWAAYAPRARGYFVNAKASAGDVLSAREVAASYAAYRLLLWRVSFGANLQQTFARLTGELRSLCYSPAFTETGGRSAAALGNRIAAAAIAYGRHDGSLEQLHYADPSFTPQNGPLVVAQPGTTVHDPTFWQPLALAQVATHGSELVPAAIQTFEGAQWGAVRGLGAPVAVHRGFVGLPNGTAYRNAALAVIRATAGRSAVTGLDPSPLGWNELVDALPSARTGSARFERDLRLELTLDRALAETAAATWGAKRKLDAPRPISMIRYLASQGQSGDRRLASYSPEGLPLAPGLVESANGSLRIRERGRWVPAISWTPPAATPASPGGVSEDAAFAAAAGRVLTALTGIRFDRRVARLTTLGLAQGIDLPADVTAGRIVGGRAAARALAFSRRLDAG